MESKPHSWEDLGITGPSRIRKLLYSRAAESLVAITSRPLASELPDGTPEVRRLYQRRPPWELYSPVSVRHPLESQDDAICCWDALLLFFNEMRYRVPDEPASSYPSELLTGRHEPRPY